MINAYENLNKYLNLLECLQFGFTRMCSPENLAIILHLVPAFIAIIQFGSWSQELEVELKRK